MLKSFLLPVAELLDKTPAPARSVILETAVSPASTTPSLHHRPAHRSTQIDRLPLRRHGRHLRQLQRDPTGIRWACWPARPPGFAAVNARLVEDLEEGGSAAHGRTAFGPTVTWNSVTRNWQVINSIQEGLRPRRLISRPLSKASATSFLQIFGTDEIFAYSGLKIESKQSSALSLCSEHGKRFEVPAGTPNTRAAFLKPSLAAKQSSGHQ